MATIRHTLQREVLNPAEERLLAVCHVNKALKKKKSSFLCLVASCVTPVTVSIYQVKKNDKNVYKNKRKWLLSDLKLVDGKNIDLETHEFDLHFDKVYKWFASNLQERQNFIMQLWKYCCRHLPKEKPNFENVPSKWLIDTSLLENENSIAPGIGAGLNEEEEIVDEYQAITESEEKDLDILMSSCQTAISNAEAFMENLAKDLSLLDGENVYSVLSSGQKVENLMDKLQEAIVEAEKVEAQLDSYDEILRHIRDTMEEMEEKNLLIEIANKNNQKLLVELENIISQLDLSQKHQNALIEADLTSPSGLKEAISAGKALIAAMNAEIHPALVRMQAVQDQRKRFEKCKIKFSQTITRFLNNLFIHLGNDPGDNLMAHSAQLVLPNHNSIHKELEIYTELIHWCKAMDRKAYLGLIKVYITSLNKLYDRDIKNFFEEARQRITSVRDRKARGSGSREDLAVKLKQQAQSLSSGVKSPATLNLLGIEREQWNQDIDEAERLRFDEIFETALTELEPFCLNEQNFCISFFQLDVLSPTTKNTQTTLDTAFSDIRDETASGTTNLPTKKVEKQINEEVRKMMGDLFHTLEPELTTFISYYEKLDGYYCMYALVRLTQHVMSAQNTESFLSKTFGSALVQVKRSYDKYMQANLKSIEEMRPNKKTKCGILPFVSNFDEFARTAQSIFKTTERRGDLDKWYQKLVGAMFDTIPKIASEHSKTPQEVVKMENFHHLHDLLSQLKIGVLDSYRKEAKVKYNEALKNYVTQYFGRPLEKLNLFFEGVEAKVAQGVKESEISYQMAFSKEQLRKVISAYPSREVKRGLENLYRKVEKHLCEDENLLQVVWRAMQEEFIQQYKYLEDFIQRCYPGSMITLEFSIKNILEFFSEIAQSH
ncbi:hypothetical protein RUM43_010710 [Polyplax serrata]|uniref:Exocyst complex component Sec3 PIP2-binding N-terminal domain-containing protein n=1 Tax=Polyplax serrata TaxID=468196 RepID=A0AAN8PW24_POLSC